MFSCGQIDRPLSRMYKFDCFNLSMSMSVYVCVCVCVHLICTQNKKKTKRKENLCSIIIVYVYVYNIHCEKESAGQTIVLKVMSYFILVLYLKHNSELEIFKIYCVNE